jgi:catechol 2,3-dioxygenase-like lactoylglutathione lyase family enzyme
MIHHIDVPVSDIDRSRTFYDKALGPLGMELVTAKRNPQGHEALGYGRAPDAVFWIRSGRPPVKRLHVAFLALTREAVDDFHRAALQVGGVCNGTPGPRAHHDANYYAAFVIDPDGNNIEAVCRHGHDAIGS